MFKLPHASVRSSPDFTQLLILCSLALFVGLMVPVHGSFVILAQIFLDTFQRGTINILNLAIPVLAALLIASSFAAFYSRKRGWGFIICLSSAYIYVTTNLYLQTYVPPPGATIRLGTAILFSSSAFLVVIGLLYIIRPGKRPQKVFWLRPEPRANRLVRLSAVFFGGGIICIQNDLRFPGYLLILLSVLLGYYAYK